MELRWYVSALIFISSYSPLALIMLIKDLDTATYRLKTPEVSLTLLAVSLVSLLILYKAMRDIRQGDAVTIESVSNKSGELVNYTIPYIVSFFGFDLADGQSLASLAIFMLLMYLLSVKTENIFINPMLSLAGYGLYDVTYRSGPDVSRQSIFLTRFELQTNTVYKIRRLSRFLFFVTEENPKD